MMYPLVLTFKNNLDNFPKENMSQRCKENLLVTVFVPDFDELKRAETSFINYLFAHKRLR